ncbi:methyltransferase domain-containing protein [Caulobacter sp. SLTY]|uniref:tRNA1(Val) (adenine(37)-N6)-methyltransferase n=1 Tax=Caulobacter sp. SLTY TaxID=2683262 RepID=UPI0014133162|nr:methyltransferase domain-containing protein [Caulobacter sp. SLTY]NBB16171.1 methyltransferase domain-containing protein [Caulobacter sp. SLTY]
MDGMDVTRDRLLNGRIAIAQPARGYRAGLDAALLAAACDAGPGERVLEAGCGVGGALMAAAWRRPEVQFTGLERDPAMAALARTNAADNGLADRVKILEGEVEAGFRALGLPSFDHAFSNPPFFDDPAALRAPAPAKSGAWMADAGLAAWTGFLLKAVREGGTITLIHRADRLADILTLLAPKAGSFRIRPVQPFADEPAKRVMVRAIKTGKAPLVLLPPLVLHPRDGGKHTEPVEAILRGEAPLGWH